MRHFILLPLLLAPLAAFAADYSDAPLVVYSGSAQKAAAAAAPRVATQAEARQATPGFPEWAITQAGQNTGGNTNPLPDAAPNAPVAAAPTNGTGTIAPAAPAAPAAPESPINKLWPRDSVPIFVQSCVGFHVELVPSCTCVITDLMLAMPHDEFLKLSADGSIERDPRLNQIRSKCIAAPKRER